MSLVGCPIPGATGFQSLSGSGSSGVLILGEAMGREEAEQGRGFVEWAQAGSVLERAIRRVGMSRDQFLIWNVVPTQPPNNWLEGAPWELEAIEWGRPFLEDIIARLRPRAILALGSVATRVTTGLSGYKMGVSNLTGFVLPSRYGIPVVPCFHPAYLRRGKMSHFGVLLRALRLATAVAREGRQPITPPVDNPPRGYILAPTEEQAEEFAREAQEAHYVAYDIETPYSNDEDSAEEAEGEQRIKSIQFSLSVGSGIFFPWRVPYVEIAKRILSGVQDKLGWNNWRFDDLVLSANNASVDGNRHDLMWAHHHAQPDLPRGLQFAAGQMGWPWPWKHLDKANAAFYGIVDVDVLQWMVA
jgi:uracil-DNA glycosylase family 4